VSGTEPVAVQPSNRLAWAPDLLVRRSDRAVLLCTNANPEPLVLRDSAIALWDEFEAGATPATVARELAARFGVEESNTARDIEFLVAELCRAGALIEIS
jgi:coenzyme PQQ synthesis protein D (PqqD)